MILPKQSRDATYVASLLCLRDFSVPLRSSRNDGNDCLEEHHSVVLNLRVVEQC